MNITISPEDIDNHVKKAIIESALGKGLQLNIDKAVKEVIGSSWDNPVKKMVEETIKTLIKEFLQKEENKAIINEAIANFITPEIIAKMLDSGIRQLKKDWDDGR